MSCCLELSGVAEGFRLIMLELIRKGDLSTFSSFRRTCRALSDIGLSAAAFPSIRYRTHDRLFLVTSLDRIRADSDMEAAFGSGSPNLARAVSLLYNAAHPVDIYANMVTNLHILMDIKNAGIVAGLVGSEECIAVHTNLVQYWHDRGLFQSLSLQDYWLGLSEPEVSFPCSNTAKASRFLWYAHGVCLRDETAGVLESYESFVDSYMRYHDGYEKQMLYPLIEALVCSKTMGAGCARIVSMFEKAFGSKKCFHHTAMDYCPPMTFAHTIAHLRGIVDYSEKIKSLCGGLPRSYNLSLIADSAALYIKGVKEGDSQEIMSRVQAVEKLFAQVKCECGRDLLCDEDFRANFATKDGMCGWHYSYLIGDAPGELMRADLARNIPPKPTLESLEKMVHEDFSKQELLGILDDVCCNSGKEGMQCVGLLLTDLGLAKASRNVHGVAKSLCKRPMYAKYVIENPRVKMSESIREDITYTMYQCVAEAYDMDVLTYFVNALHYQPTTNKAMRIISKLLGCHFSPKYAISPYACENMPCVLTGLCANMSQEDKKERIAPIIAVMLASPHVRALLCESIGVTLPEGVVE